MYSLNSVKIIGILTEDPQIRTTPSGQSVGDLNIITKYTFRNKDGGVQSTRAYHTVVVWRGLADICGQYLRKGSNVYIAGRLETSSWEDESGNKKSKTRIIADEMIMLDGKHPAEPMPDDVLVSGLLNQAEIIGNITRDPELRQTPNGSSVVSFGVATNYSWKDKDGQTHEKTEFHNVVLWEKLAEDAAKYLKKGRKVYVNGRLQTRSWETPNGQKRYTTEIIGDKIYGLGNIVIDDIAVQKEAPEKEAVSVSASSDQTITPDMIPEINYEKDVKPEDLPF